LETITTQAGEVNDVLRTRARERIGFGQIRTLELRISAQIRPIDEIPISPLRCSVTQTCVELAQCRELFKTGSNPVRVAPLVMQGDWPFV
jgi:hypothetical protein